MGRNNGKRAIPENREAERSVIGAVLLENQALTRARLSPEHFFDPRHREIWRAILQLAAKGRPIDPVMIESELNGRFDKVGGYSALAELVRDVPTADNIEHYVELVRAAALTRDVHIAASEILGSNLDGEELRKYVEDRLGQLASTRPLAQLGSIGAMWRNVSYAHLSEVPDARRWLLRHPTRDGRDCATGQGDGMLPLGKVGILSSAGGIGKTHVLLLLAVAIITGKRFLGYFDVGYEARGRRVFLGLAEEDMEEIHRRLYNAAEAYGLTPDERRLVSRMLVALPLAGHAVSLVSYAADGRTLVDGPELLALRQRLQQDAGPGWGLVALDPLARWAGPDVEADNSVATRFLQAVETLTSAPGDPTVLMAHHSSKVARNIGAVDSRGVTAITDGARWAGTLRAEGDSVYFQQTKSNYSRPMPTELRLVREDDGLLRAASLSEDEARAATRDAAREAREEARIQLMQEKIIAAMRASSTPLTSRAQVSDLVSGERTIRVQALSRLLASGRVCRVERNAEMIFEVVNGPN